MKTQGYKDLIVWQKSMDLVVAVYELTANLPDSERFGLVSQMRRSAVSIPSNISEGRYRSTKKDFRQFVLISFGSGAELETHVQIIKRLSFGKQIDTSKVDNLLTEVMRMLNSLASSLKANPL